MSELASKLKAARGVLMDFDGPVCSLFNGYPASAVADEIRALFPGARAGFPPPLDTGPHPLRLLEWIGENRRDMLTRAEKALINAELEAAETAKPTPAAHRMLEASARISAVAIVSNNSVPAIQRYLSQHGLSNYVAAIEGRRPGRTDQMKPHPEPVLRAVRALGVPVTSCVLVGDSPTDMTAAKRAGVYSVGYAKFPDRIPGLEGAGADAIVQGMDVLADMLEDARPSASR